MTSGSPPLTDSETQLQREARWLYSGDTGLSSKTIFSVLSTLHGPNDRARAPQDPADLGRCLRLLDLLPEFRPRLQEVADLYPEWQPLVDHWDDLCALYYEELPSGLAPKCYALMKALLRGAE